MKRVMSISYLALVFVFLVSSCGGATASVTATIHSAKQYHKTEKSFWEEPDAGFMYVSFDLEVRNTGSKSLDLSQGIAIPTDTPRAYMSVVDDKGFQGEQSIPIEDPEFNPGELFPGSLARGYVTWKVVDSWQSLKLSVLVGGKTIAVVQVLRGDLQ